MKEHAFDMNRLEALFGEETNVGKMFLHLRNAGDMHKEESEFVRKYLPIVKETQKSDEKVFLSVLTRTQGRRPQELREVFLCLSAQTDMDFEILLVGHKISEEQERDLQAIIDEQVEPIRKRVRFIKLDYGNRTAPLNFGFAHARGEYVAILDDDDVVFADWVEEFHKAAQKRPGTLLHSYAAFQHWMKIGKGALGGNVRASGSPNPIYCTPFNWPKQMHCNNCPPVGLAFPTMVFQELGVIFDETLTTTEDWDYLQRVVTLSGVSDVKKVTCIYRWWVNTESSQTVHSKREWDYNYEVIQKKMRASVTLFPEFGSSQLLALMAPPAQEVVAAFANDSAATENIHFWEVKRAIRLYIKNKWKKIRGKKPTEIVHFKDVKKLVKLYMKKKKNRR